MIESRAQEVLLVTDDSELTRFVLQMFAAESVRGTVACNVATALNRVASDDCCLVLADMEALAGQQSEFLRQINACRPEIPVVMISDAMSVPSVVKLLRDGWEDVLEKPLRRKALVEQLDVFLPRHDVAYAESGIQDPDHLDHIAGQSQSVINVVKRAKKLAPTSIPILLTGESGTGKELLAHFIHRNSNRAQGAYIRINCAALSESLLESEIFGHEKGSFTGANAQHKGKFERADGGTLLLDEISETGPRLQAELLRIIESQDFERVGGSEIVRVNVRLIATSNRDLKEEVARGGFRSDLYYRIACAHLDVPPLRNRRDDIPSLVWHFVNMYAGEARRGITSIDSKMLKSLVQYRWPGNIRELRNIVRTSLVFGEGPVLTLPEDSLAVDLPADVMQINSPSLALREVERHVILEALRRTNLHQAKAAELLGITDRTLREKLRRYREDGHLNELEEVVC